MQDRPIQRHPQRRRPEPGERACHRPPIALLVVAVRPVRALLPAGTLLMLYARRDRGDQAHVGAQNRGGECPINGGSGLVGSVDSSFERYRECVEGGLPAHHRLACSASAGGVEGSGHEVEALQGGVVVWEVSSGSDCASVVGVDRLDRVGATDHASDLHVVVKERDELAPGVLPQLAPSLPSSGETAWL
jgi:hypothetical protein